MVDMIPADELVNHCKDKKELYKAAQRNQVLIPSLKSRLCTVEFLIQIKNNAIYFVQGAQIRDFQIATPPKRQVLQEELVRHCRMWIRNQGCPRERNKMEMYVRHLTLRDADLPYLIKALGTLTEGRHPFFARDYVAPKIKRSIIPRLYVADPHGFFRGLPPSTNRARVVRPSVLFLTEEEQQVRKDQVALARAEYYEQLAHELRAGVDRGAEESVQNDPMFEDIGDLNELALNRTQASTQHNSMEQPNTIYNQED